MLKIKSQLKAILLYKIYCVHCDSKGIDCFSYVILEIDTQLVHLLQCTNKGLLTLAAVFNLHQSPLGSGEAYTHIIVVISISFNIG